MVLQASLFICFIWLLYVLLVPKHKNKTIVAVVVFGVFVALSLGMWFLAIYGIICLIYYIAFSF